MRRHRRVEFLGADAIEIAKAHAALENCGVCGKSALRKQGGEGNLAGLFSPEVSVLSYQMDLRKPSPSLYEVAAERCRAAGFAPEEVLYLTNRLTDDLGMAKQAGFHTGLMVVDESCTQIEAADLKNPEFRPERLLTDLRQVLEIVGG